MAKVSESVQDKKDQSPLWGHVRTRMRQSRGFVKFLLVRIFTENIAFMAGSIAFYTLLSVFPAMTAVVSLYGLISDVDDVQKQMGRIEVLLPPQAFEILYQQLVSVVSVSSTSLSLTVVGSILVAVFSAARGMKALLAALNIVYKVKEKRPWWKLNLVAYGMTFSSIVFLAISILTLVGLPIIINILQIPSLIENQIFYIRWIVLGIFLIIGLIMLYAAGPARKERRQHRLSLICGALAAAFLWLAMSFGFTHFVEFFPRFNQVYGSLGAVVILMFWFYLSAYAVIVGAAIHVAFEEYFNI